MPACVMGVSSRGCAGRTLLAPDSAFAIARLGRSDDVREVFPHRTAPNDQPPAHRTSTYRHLVCCPRAGATARGYGVTRGVSDLARSGVYSDRAVDAALLPLPGQRCGARPAGSRPVRYSVRGHWVARQITTGVDASVRSGDLGTGDGVKSPSAALRTAEISISTSARISSGTSSSPCSFKPSSMTR